MPAAPVGTNARPLYDPGEQAAGRLRVVTSIHPYARAPLGRGGAGRGVTGSLSECRPSALGFSPLILGRQTCRARMERADVASYRVWKGRGQSIAREHGSMIRGLIQQDRP